MFGYLTGKRETKTSKRVTIVDLEGNSTECLINVDNFESLPINYVVEYEISDYWGSARIPIISKLTQYNGDAPEALWLTKMYGPKPVPKLREVLNKCVEFINSTPDQSNINGQPRQITYEQFEEAIKEFLSDDDGVNRLALLVKCPASTKYHDSQPGGLLRHTSKMLEMCIKVFQEQWWSDYELHPLRLITGILFHDMGKIDQYVYNDVTRSWEYAEYATYRGNHIGIALERWARKGRKVCEILGDDSMFWDVWHMIGSHHGKVELGYGSLMDPFGHDAETLYALDMLESRQEEHGKPPKMEE